MIFCADKFDYQELDAANKFFAATIFVSFTLGVSFILISFMVTIILDGFTQVTVSMVLACCYSSEYCISVDLLL